MNWRAIRAVMRKDLLVVMRSRTVVLPMIVVPVLMQVILPAAMGIMANVAADSLASDMGDFEQLLDAVPASVQGQLAGLDDGAVVLVLMLVYLFAPLFLIVPMMVSSVIAADSFVGERERKTLEALLHAPLEGRELLLAKLLAAWVAALAVAVGSFVLYSIVVNAVGWPVMGRIFFPNAMWLVLILWVTPAVAGLGLAATVLISARVKTFQEAYQLGGIIILPIVALVIGQIAGVVFLSVGFALAMGLAVWLVDGVLLWFGVQTFKPEEMLARL